MSFLFTHCTLCTLTKPDTPSVFTCGDNDLDEFFSHDCFGYSRQLLGKTYCYRLDLTPHDIVCAFTLSNASIRVSDLPNARKKKIETDIPHAKALKDYPAVLLGRLGVSVKYRSLHIGSDVLEYLKYWFVDPNNKTGCRFIIVDAYAHTETMSFYGHNGFKTVFSTDAQEKEYRHMNDSEQLRTRLMYFDLLTATKK